MTEFRTRDQLLLAKAEATRGVEETPTVGANAIRCESIQHSPNLETLQTDEHQDGLDQSEAVMGGGNAGLRFTTLVKGSGSAGTAPDYGELLEGAGFSETLTAADVTGTAQAGAAGSITLAAGASSTTDIYKGMVIDITGGTGAAQESRVITAYNGSTKVASVYPNWAVTPDNTSVYAVRANALYRPVSSNLKALTLWAYQHHRNGTDSRLRKVIGGIGNFDLTVPVRGLARMNWDFMGILPAAPADVSRPAAPTFQAKNEEPFLNAQAYLGGAAVKFGEFSFALGNERNQFDNPAAPLGYDVGDVTSRASSGRVTPNLTSTSARNSFLDWMNSTSKPLWLRWGSAAGRRVSLYLPALRYTGQEEADIRGYAAIGIPFDARTPNGAIWACVH